MHLDHMFLTWNTPKEKNKTDNLCSSVITDPFYCPVFSNEIIFGPAVSSFYPPSPTDPVTKEAQCTANFPQNQKEQTWTPEGKPGQEIGSDHVAYPNTITQVTATDTVTHISNQKKANRTHLSCQRKYSYEFYQTNPSIYCHSPVIKILRPQLLILLTLLYLSIILWEITKTLHNQCLCNVPCCINGQ